VTDLSGRCSSWVPQTLAVRRCRAAPHDSRPCVGMCPGPCASRHRPGAALPTRVGPIADRNRREFPPEQCLRGDLRDGDVRSNIEHRVPRQHHARTRLATNLDEPDLAPSHRSPHASAASQAVSSNSGRSRWACRSRWAQRRCTARRRPSRAASDTLIPNSRASAASSSSMTTEARIPDVWPRNPTRVMRSYAEPCERDRLGSLLPDPCR
jgi:hypothetical protein